MLDTLDIGVLGFRNQERIDRITKSVDETSVDTGFTIRKTLIDNGDLGLKAPSDWKVLRTGPGKFTPGINAFLRSLEPLDSIPVILNDDLEIQPDCFRILGERIQEGYGIVAPMQVLMSNPQLVICGGFGAAFPVGIHETGMVGDPRFSKLKDCRWVTFAAVALHPRMLKDVGYLDENMEMWYSDSDLSVRAKWAGWKLALDPRAVVKHENHATCSEEFKDVYWQRLMIKDRSMFERKYTGAIMSGVI